MQNETTRITLFVTQTLERMHWNPRRLICQFPARHHALHAGCGHCGGYAARTYSPLVVVRSQEFYADDEMMRGAIAHHSSFNLIHYETAFKVDIFIRKTRAFDQLQLERRRESVMTTDPDPSVYVTSLEDTIPAKLEWYHLGGEVSGRQRRDLLGVFKTQAGELELDYWRKWARELNVTDLLKCTLKETE